MSGKNGARVTAPNPKDKAPPPLDPSLPTYHLIPAPVMQDLIEIVKELPYDKVYRVMPHLVSAEVIQKPDK